MPKLSLVRRHVCTNPYCTRTFLAVAGEVKCPACGSKMELEAERVKKAEKAKRTIARIFSPGPAPVAT